MGPLRVRRADTAPAGSLDEFFGKLPESVIEDRDLIAEAKVTLAAVYLDMARNRNPVLSLATNEDLARSVGESPRSVTRHLARLEARGHLSRERVRTIAGSPRGLRPLRKLKGVRHQYDTTPVTRCNSTPVSMHLDTDDDAPSQECRGASTPMTTPLKREGEEDQIRKNRPAASGGRRGRPQPAGGEETERARDAALRAAWATLPEAERSEIVATVKADNPGIARWPKMVEPLCLAALEARGEAPGPTAKSAPGPEAGNSVPDAKECTTQPDSPSRDENGVEHKSR